MSDASAWGTMAMDTAKAGNLLELHFQLFWPVAHHLDGFMRSESLPAQHNAASDQMGIWKGAYLFSCYVRAKLIKNIDTP